MRPPSRPLGGQQACRAAEPYCAARQQLGRVIGRKLVQLSLRRAPFELRVAQTGRLM